MFFLTRRSSHAALSYTYYILKKEDNVYSMYVLDVLRKRGYFVLAAGAALFMFFFYPYVQTLGLQTDLWYQIISLPNFILFLAFVVVFGIFVAFQTHTFKQPKVCAVTKKGTTSGIIGTAFSFFIGMCPACVGFAALLLPLGIVTTLVIFGPLFMLVSIGLLLISIHLNRGFRHARDR
jgi:hypothetical protein